MSQNEKIGQQIWQGFRESPTDCLKADAFIPEAVMLFGEACRCFDASAYQGVAILCRSTLESAFLEFLSTEWYDNNSFNVVYPTGLDGKPRRVEFEELENGINQRVDFSEEHKIAIRRIREDGNFVAHFASRKINQRFKVSKDFEKWEASNKDVAGLERINAVTKIYRSARPWIYRDEALGDLRDTLVVIVTLCKAMRMDVGGVPKAT